MPRLPPPEHTEREDDTLIPDNGRAIGAVCAVCSRGGDAGCGHCVPYPWLLPGGWRGARGPQLLPHSLQNGARERVCVFGTGHDNDLSEAAVPDVSSLAPRNWSQLSGGHCLLGESGSHRSRAAPP